MKSKLWTDSPHTINISYANLLEKASWCDVCVGVEGKDWNWTWGCGDNSLVIFGFQRSQDATAFALRWL